MLDVGCGKAPWDLYELKLSPFKKLMGFDEDPNIPLKVFQFYVQVEAENSTIHPQPKLSVPELHRQFLNRFNIFHCNLSEFNFHAKEYSLIICNNVLHFFSDNKKLRLLKKFYRSLQFNRLLFIRISNCSDPLYGFLIKTEDDGFLPPEIVGEEFRTSYPIEPNRFVPDVSNYTVLSNYTKTTLCSPRFVIRKDKKDF